MPPPRPPISTVLPPLVLGTTTFNHQYNTDPHNLPTTKIIHTALAQGINAFDTSPYYGPAETLLGAALLSSTFPRHSYFLSTKVGRIAADKFDYSPNWIRESIARSLQRLGTDYLDIVYCHDVEFVTPADVMTAVLTLRDLRDEGKIRYVGISGYPTELLVELSVKVKKETGEPLDTVMSYAHYTLQNTVLSGPQVLGRLVAEEAGVGCVLNGSPLGMGLLRSQGVPIGDLGDFHPAPGELRSRCVEAAGLVERYTGGKQKLETLALWYSIEGWAQDGAEGGTEVNPLVTAKDSLRSVNIGVKKIGISVASVSSIRELDELLAIWEDVVGTLEKRFLWAGVQAVFSGDMGRREWRNYSWPSPGVGYIRSRL